MTAPTIVEAGRIFGRLCVIGYSGAGYHKCECACGTIREVQTMRLISGKTTSCGCRLNKERDPQTKEATVFRRRTYDIWRQMIARCTDPKNNSFQQYGARGVTVCARWRDSFESFLSDMGHCPEGFSIDRGEVDGNYEPSNCKWIPMEKQASTKRSAKRRIKATPTILSLRKQGSTQEEIAGQVGVDQTTVSRVLAAHGMRTRVNNGRNWRSA